jgi:hypothetical protein
MSRLFQARSGGGTQAELRGAGRACTPTLMVRWLRYSKGQPAPMLPVEPREARSEASLLFSLRLPG